MSLNVLFGRERVNEVLPRLKEIFEHSEEVWAKYIDNLPDGVVQRVLIAEAPPWSQEGTPQYLLDPNSQVRTLMGAIRQVFPGAHVGTSADALRIMAYYGFLLFDSIPFSMDYRCKRSSPSYFTLVRLTVSSYLQSKIDSSPLKWSPDLAIAFAVHRNACAILRSTSQLSFGGRPVNISEQMIAVNRAGYPDSAKLRAIYGC